MTSFILDLRVVWKKRYVKDMKNYMKCEISRVSLFNTNMIKELKSIEIKL